MLSSFQKNQNSISLCVSVCQVETPAEWDKLLQKQSPHKLLYSVLLLEYFFEPHPDETEEWIRKFLDRGGFEVIYGILVSML